GGVPVEGSGGGQGRRAAGGQAGGDRHAGRESGRGGAHCRPRLRIRLSHGGDGCGGASRAVRRRVGRDTGAAAEHHDCASGGVRTSSDATTLRCTSEVAEVSCPEAAFSYDVASYHGYSSSTMPLSSHRCSPASVSCATWYAWVSALWRSSRNLTCTRASAWRQKRSASSTARRPAAGSCRKSHCARAHAAAMANSSAPTSTNRNSTAWRYSSLGPKRTMAWNTPRARRRAPRSTARRCRARIPNSAYLGQKLQPSQRDGYHHTQNPA